MLSHSLTDRYGLTKSLLDATRVAMSTPKNPDVLAQQARDGEVRREADKLWMPRSR